MPRLAVLVSVLGAFLLSVGIFVGNPGARAEDATPAAGAAATPCAAATVEENEALVRRWFAEVWRPGGEAALAELVDPNVVHHWGIGQDTTDSTAFAERLQEFLVGFPDLTFTVDEVFGQGDLVATRWTATGTNLGELRGIAATNRTVAWTGMNIFRIDCGKIVESWNESDHLGLRQQLGMLPQDATPTA
jgi:steroid delta-isomerase-like uncharacterized protein